MNKPIIKDFFSPVSFGQPVENIHFFLFYHTEFTSFFRLFVVQNLRSGDGFWTSVPSDFGGAL